MLRGGGWNNNARNCRAANRNNNTPDNRNNNIGFRLVGRRAQPPPFCRSPFIHGWAERAAGGYMAPRSRVGSIRPAKYPTLPGRAGSFGEGSAGEFSLSKKPGNGRGAARRAPAPAGTGNPFWKRRFIGTNPALAFRGKSGHFLHAPGRGKQRPYDRRSWQNLNSSGFADFAFLELGLWGFYGFTGFFPEQNPAHPSNPKNPSSDRQSKSRSHNHPPSGAHHAPPTNPIPQIQPPPKTKLKPPNGSAKSGAAPPISRTGSPTRRRKTWKSPDPNWDYGGFYGFRGIPPGKIP